MSTAPSPPIGTGPNVALMNVLNPSFKGVPDAKAVAVYLLNALIQIKKEGLPVKIYLTQDVTNKIGNILTSLGIKIRTVSAEKMSPPYIYLFTENGDIVIKTVDPEGKEVASIRAPFNKFIDAFEAAFTSKRDKKAKAKEKPVVVDEIIASDIEPEKFLEHVEKLIKRDSDTSQ